MKIRSIALSICICAFSLSSIFAGTIIVTSTADSGVGSLRDALAAANAGDTIQFDPALTGQTIVLTSDQLYINENLFIEGLGANQLTIERSHDVGTINFRIFSITPGHTVTIQGLTIRNGVPLGGLPAGCGGGVLNDHSTLTINDSVITDNTALFSWGGGVCNYGEGGGSASLTINNSTVSGNQSRNSGGGIYSSAHGGGSVMTSISNSTISSNVSSTDVRVGAGLSNDGYNSTAILRISNSTLSGSPFESDGGGISNYGSFGKATLTITNSTLYSMGGIFNYAGTTDLANTILQAGVSGVNIQNTEGTISSHGYNISSDNGGGFLTAAGDQINTNPLLGPLQDNGGPTSTHQLLIDSPAINAGDPAFSPPPNYDQRGPGFPRISSGRIDIGSFEFQTAVSPTRMLNISTRLRVLTGDNALIGGFIVSGTESKRVIVRGIGPSLTKFGVPDALSNPTLELHGPSGFNTVVNDNWRDAQETDIEATGLAPIDDLESAIVAMLQPGAYTAVLQGSGGGVGVGLVEAYDLNAATNAQLANISTRGFVDSGDNAMIGGFILSSGSTNATVLIRGIGPSLKAFGVPESLGDPTLELHDNNGSTIGTNDDWREAQEVEIEETGLAPTDDFESAILQDFSPGAYTAIVQGKNGTTGVALVEAYQLTSASISRRDFNCLTRTK